MVSEWRTLPLEECMAAIIDYRGKSPTKTGAGIPLVTAKVIKSGRIERLTEFIAEADFEQWMRRGIPLPGDVVMTTEAPLGEVAQLDHSRVALAQRVITLRGKANLLDNTFLKFLLQSKSVQDQLHSRSTGTTVLGIRQTELRKITLVLPPLREQKAIAAVLGALDDKIELNRQMNATLESTTRALFQSWFVDFDPSCMQVDEHRRVATDGLFPSSFQESPLGQVPRGWMIGSVLDQAELLSGGTPNTGIADYWNGDIPWASAKDVSQCQDTFLITTERKITERGVNESSTRIIPALATVIVARGATTGRMTMLGEPMAMNQTCYGLRSRNGTPYALYCHARDFVGKLVQSGHGSVFNTITTSTFQTTQVLLPPPNVLQAFDRVVEPFFLRILSNLQESRVLSQLRNALLPKLLSGEVRVTNGLEETA